MPAAINMSMEQSDILHGPRRAAEQADISGIRVHVEPTDRMALAIECARQKGRTAVSANRDETRGPPNIAPRLGPRSIDVGDQIVIFGRIEVGELKLMCIRDVRRILGEQHRRCPTAARVVVQRAIRIDDDPARSAGGDTECPANEIGTVQHLRRGETNGIARAAEHRSRTGEATGLEIIRDRSAKRTIVLANKSAGRAGAFSHRARFV